MINYSTTTSALAPHKPNTLSKLLVNEKSGVLSE